RHDLAVDLDRHPAAAVAGRFEQFGDRASAGQLARRAVQLDVHAAIVPVRAFHGHGIRETIRHRSRQSMERRMSQSRKPLRTLLAAALALAAAPALAQDSPFSQSYFFGDSLTDSGHYRPVLVQMIGPDGALIGKFTTNPGLVWAEYLAAYYGTDASTDGDGGTNYAVGGARAGVDTVGGLGPTPSLATQVGAYLA